MLTDNLTYVLRDIDHGIADSVRIAAADRIEALEAWKAEAMEVLRPFASDISMCAVNADYEAARRLVEKEDGR